MKEVNLFENSNLKVVAFDNGSSDCIITFSNWSKYPAKVDREGFAKPFIDKKNISSVYFISKKNHWWQIAEIYFAISLVNSYTQSRYNRITLYGSSMGAYGALLFHKNLNADRVLAISPQFSIDRKVARFETRWTEEYEATHFIHDDMLLACESNVEKYIFSTDESLDLRQAKLFQNLCKPDNTFIYFIRFAGHPCGPYLLETGILSRLVSNILIGDVVEEKEIKNLLQEAWSKRKESPTYLYYLARRIHQKRPKRSLTLLKSAVQKFNDNSLLQQLVNKLSDKD